MVIDRPNRNDDEFERLYFLIEKMDYSEKSQYLKDLLVEKQTNKSLFSKLMSSNQQFSRSSIEEVLEKITREQFEKISNEKKEKLEREVERQNFERQRETELQKQAKKQKIQREKEKEKQRIASRKEIIELVNQQKELNGGTLIDKYKEDYEAALTSIDVDVKKLIKDGHDMKGLMLLQENIAKIKNIHDSLEIFYNVIFTWQSTLSHFKSERLRQLGHELVMLSSTVKEMGHYELKVVERTVMDQLNKLGFTRKHWLLKEVMINEIEYLLEVLQILIEPEFVPLEQDNKEITEDQKTERYIPSSVKISVWRRDSGKCVDCGSQERLEYDHIIPVSKGGSNTERNVQLLCEKCNRQKCAAIQ